MATGRILFWQLELASNDIIPIMAQPESRNSIHDFFNEGITEEMLSVSGLKKLFPLFIKDLDNPVELLKVARTFLQAVFEADPNAIDGFLNVKIVQRCENELQGLDCHGFLFGAGTDEDTERILTNLFRNYSMSSEPVANAFALYINDEITKPLHIGKVTEDKTVISKWGINGHVYEHPPLLVPLSYGWNIAYLHK